MTEVAVVILYGQCIAEVYNFNFLN